MMVHIFGVSKHQTDGIFFVNTSLKKLLEISQGVFSVIFAFGELYCFAVIFRLRLSDIALRAVERRI